MILIIFLDLFLYTLSSTHKILWNLTFGKYMRSLDAKVHLTPPPVKTPNLIQSNLKYNEKNIRCLALAPDERVNNSFMKLTMTLAIKFRFIYNKTAWRVLRGQSLMSKTGVDFWCTQTRCVDDATCGTRSSPSPTPPPVKRRKSAPSFFFYIRERGKKNHRFSLRSTRRQLYESLPRSLDLRHISFRRSPRTIPPPPLHSLSSSACAPSPSRRAAREEDIIYFVN